MLVTLTIFLRERWPIVVGGTLAATMLTAVAVTGRPTGGAQLGIAGLVWGIAGLAVASGLAVQLARAGRTSLQRERRLVTAAAALREASAELERIARRDALTGIPNRLSAQERLAMEFERARRYGRPFAVLMVDIDHFKRVNDRHGHASGDSVLSSVATTLQEQVRATDLVSRYGGEEFLILLPETTEQEAALVAEKLRAAVAAIEVTGSDGDSAPKQIPVTASIGVAAMSPIDLGEAAFVARADLALYAAKRGGRNRVSTAGAASGRAGGTREVA